MAIRTRDEIMEIIRARTEGQTDDETLSFISDVTDTLNDFDSKLKSNTDWKAKYEDNDRSWREKYKERFFTGSSEDKEIATEGAEEKKPLTYEDLFTRKGDK